jgi:curved DNA-binding protein CbpA
MPVGHRRDHYRRAEAIRRLFFIRPGDSLVRTLYGVLGLPLRAGEAEIKAAFRKLAKRYHPDLNAGDARAEQRFKEINEAHAILNNPDARARYDAGLLQERWLRRQRLRYSAAIMAASFVLTVMVISTPIIWRQYGNGMSLLSAGREWMKPSGNGDRRTVAVLEDGATQVEGKRAADQSPIALPTSKWHAETASTSRRSSADAPMANPPSSSQSEEPSAHDDSGRDIALQETERLRQTAMADEQAVRSASSGRLSGPGDSESGEGVSQTETVAQEKRGGVTDPAMALPSWKDGGSWASYRNVRFGFALRYPADIFVLEPTQSDEHVKSFRSRDGRAALRIFGTPNLAGRTLAQYRMMLIQESYAKATFDYAPQRDTWFVLSGFTENDIFYERVTFACDRRSFHGWMLIFPASERGLYERIIEGMHRNYRHSNGQGARCGVGKPQVSAGTKPRSGTIDGSL